MEFYNSMKELLNGFSPADAVLQLLMLLAILWLLFRGPRTAIEERLDHDKDHTDLGEVRSARLEQRLRNLEAWQRTVAVPANGGKQTKTGSQGGTSYSDPRPAGGKDAARKTKFVETTEAKPAAASQHLHDPGPVIAAAPQPYDTAAPHPQVRHLYARSPETDGYFKAANLQTESAYHSLYELIVDPEGDTARVLLHSKPDAHQTAIQSPSTYLNPVCEYDSAPQHGASRINTLSEGFAVLEGERWRMQRKLKVDFS